MNYCVYNIKLDQFLCLFNNPRHGFVNHDIKWSDEFVYALADLNKIDGPAPLSTAWSMDTDDKRGNFFVFIYRIIHRENNMKDIRVVQITDCIPDFKKELICLKQN